MIFSSSKFGQEVEILATGALGQLGISTFTPPTSGEIETFVHTLVQVVVGLVTIYATVRKLFQQPESVVKLPAAGAVAVAVPPAPAASAVVVAEPAAVVPAASAAPAPTVTATADVVRAAE